MIQFPKQKPIDYRKYIEPKCQVFEKIGSVTISKLVATNENKPK